MNLEVGMRLYCGLNRYTISRVTPKRAYIKVNDSYEVEFNRDFKSGCHFIYERGAHGLHRSVYELETPGLIAAFNRGRLVRKAMKINMNILTDDQLNRIMAIGDEVTK
jgi:hypothetical protein